MVSKNVLKLLCLSMLMQACGSDSHVASRGQSGQVATQDADGVKIPIPVPNQPEAPISAEDEAFFALLKSAESISDEDVKNINVPGKDVLDGLAKLMDLLKGKIDIDLGVLKDKLKEIFPDLEKIGGLDGLNRAVVVYAISVMAAEDSGRLEFAERSAFPIMEIIAVIQIIVKVIEIFSDPNTSLEDLIDMIKTGDINKIIELIKDILGGVTTATSDRQVNPLQTLPDFSKLLGIDGIKDLEKLKDSFKVHVKHVLDNFDGPIKDALISLLKLSYGQAYQGLKS